MKAITILDIKSFEKLEAESFYCNTFSEHLRRHHQNITTPHKHNFYLCVLFTQGSGRHEIDFESYAIAPGEVFFLKPGQTHHWELSNDVEGYIFFHSHNFYELEFTSQSILDYPFYYSRQNKPSLTIPEEQTSFIKNTFISLMNEYTTNQAFKKQKILSLLQSLYIDLSRLYAREQTATNSPEVTNNQYLHRLELLIENNFHQMKSPSAYAERLNITTRHLNRLTQNSFGKSTSELITERVILEAKRLLIYKEIALTDISFQLGFEEYTYFSRIFKKHTGTTPRDFRKKYHSKSISY